MGLSRSIAEVEGKSCKLCGGIEDGGEPGAEGCGYVSCRKSIGGRARFGRGGAQSVGEVIGSVGEVIGLVSETSGLVDRLRTGGHQRPNESLPVPVGRSSFPSVFPALFLAASPGVVEV